MLAANALTTLERTKLILGLPTDGGILAEQPKQEPDLLPDGETQPEQVSEQPEQALKQVEQVPGITNNEDARINLILEMLINKASSWIERQICRHLGKNTYHQWYDADGRQELVLLEYPIIDVEYIKEAGRIVDPLLYDYGQTANIGVVYRDDGWLKAGYRRGLANDMIEPKRNIEVQYTAGYVLPKDATEENPQTLPADLEGLVWDMVSQEYANMQNGAQGLKSFSISDVRWEFDKSAQSSWTQLINLYRRY